MILPCPCPAFSHLCALGITLSQLWELFGSAHGKRKLRFSSRHISLGATRFDYAYHSYCYACREVTLSLLYTIIIPVTYLLTYLLADFHLQSKVQCWNRTSMTSVTDAGGLLSSVKGSRTVTMPTAMPPSHSGSRRTGDVIGNGDWRTFCAHAHIRNRMIAWAMLRCRVISSLVARRRPDTTTLHNCWPAGAASRDRSTWPGGDDNQGFCFSDVGGSERWWCHGSSSWHESVSASTSSFSQLHSALNKLVKLSPTESRKLSRWNILSKVR